MPSIAALVMFLVIGITVPGSLWGAPGSTPRPVAAPAAKTAAAAAIDLNKAVAEELLTVPGIGPALARRILDLRAKKGSFARIEDLLEVSGVGEKNLKRFAEYLVVPQVPPPATTTRKP